MGNSVQHSDNCGVQKESIDKKSARNELRAKVITLIELSVVLYHENCILLLRDD